MRKTRPEESKRRLESGKATIRELTEDAGAVVRHRMLDVSRFPR